VLSIFALELLFQLTDYRTKISGKRREKMELTYKSKNLCFYFNFLLSETLARTRSL